MAKKLSLLLISLILLKAKMFAQKTNNFSIGVNFLIPASVPDTNKTIGSGIHFGGEHFFSPRISGNVSIGYLLFKGKIITWDNKEVKNFAMLPLLIGGKFYIENFYVGVDAGIAIAANKNTGTNLVLSPAIGYRRKHLDVGFYLLGVPQTFASIPENIYFIKGGYSYLGLRVNYILTK
jgi:hypothetical protein